MPRTDPVHQITALTGPVEVDYDHWGVPHIRAGNASDLFVAQGFTAARDRLFQLDLWRRRGRGLLSEALGDTYLEQDRAARLFLYRGDMRAEWNSYGPDAKRIATSFTDGINAYVELTEGDPDLLGPEFTEAGFTPGRWTPEDLCLIRSHGLYGNIEQELARAITLHEFGAQTEELRSVREPSAPLTVPEGLDLSLFHDGILRDYRLACAPVDLAGGAGEPRTPTEPDGSNNWVIGPHRTATGRPQLANDPHRAVTSPALRYITHLTCPEFDVIGAGEPAMPGVSIGHNGTVAFGLTIFPIDQEDLYVYELHPQDPGLYRYRGQWRPFETVTESVPVRGSGQRPVELVFSCHGPVVYTDADRNAAFAVRAAWLEPGMAPYLGSIQYMRAKNSQQFRDAMSSWGAPGENQVYADTTGDFGWIPGGLVPVRPNWDGSLPVPGDGSHEWAGFRTGDELPSSHNPEEGWFASANHYNLPEDGSWEPFTVSQDWMAPFRYRRIAEELASHEEWTVQDSTRLQNDYVSLPAKEVTAALNGLDSDDEDTRRALGLLSEWDGSMLTGLPQPTLYEHWFRNRLRPALTRRALAEFLDGERVEDAVRQVSPKEDGTGDPRVGLRLLEEAVRTEQGRALVLSALGLAYADLVERLGEPGPDWHWGHHHFTRPPHPLGGGAQAPDWANLEPLAKDGSADTVALASYDTTGRQTMGATFRVVVDVGEWDNSVAINSPGQSGDPRSPHFDDLYRLWGRDGYFPLSYSRKAVEENRAHGVRLSPADG